MTQYKIGDRVRTQYGYGTIIDFDYDWELVIQLDDPTYAPDYAPDGIIMLYDNELISMNTDDGYYYNAI